MITTRADDHRGVLIARRAAPGGDKPGCPSPAPAGGLGCDGMSSSGPMQPHHCLSGCKTLTRGQEGRGGDRKDTEGDSSLLLHPQVLSHRRGGCREGNIRRENVTLNEPPVQQECPKAEGSTGPPSKNSQTLPKPLPYPQQVPQEGLGLLPWGARKETAKTPANSTARH